MMYNDFTPKQQVQPSETQSLPGFPLAPMFEPFIKSQSLIEQARRMYQVSPELFEEFLVQLEEFKKTIETEVDGDPQ